MRHKHHIIPKHRGGSNEPSNLVEVSLTQHAMFHYCEWKLYGKRSDYVAWKRLVGNLNDEELVHQKLIMGGGVNPLQNLFGLLPKTNHSKTFQVKKYQDY